MMSKSKTSLASIQQVAQEQKRRKRLAALHAVAKAAQDEHRPPPTWAEDGDETDMDF
jgi:hypothetical protein